MCIYMLIFLIKSVIQQMLVISVIVAEGRGSSSETHPSVMEGGIAPSPADQPCSISSGSSSVYLIYGTQLE